MLLHMYWLWVPLFYQISHAFHPLFKDAQHTIFLRRTKREMIWGYPIFGDEPSKKRLPKVDPIWELGQLERSHAWSSPIANRLAQERAMIPGMGTITSIQEHGLGRTEKVAMKAEEAVGGSDVDYNEKAKIASILPIFDQGNGLGVATLLGARNGTFAFKYNGPIQNYYGIRSWLRYLIHSVYPTARVYTISEHWFDRMNKPLGQQHWVIPPSLTSNARKAVTWKYPYMHENEGDMPSQQSFGIADPQMIS